MKALIKKLFVPGLLIILFISCGTLDPQQADTKPISHESLTQLLLKYVDEAGMVDYAGLSQERSKLDAYLRLLSNNAPNDSNWTEEDQIAYWLNTYNAYTLDLILDHYPLESIKDISSVVSIPYVNSPWDIKFIMIAGKEYDLNNIEHNILRKKWNEPRIHFAVNCASMSCPKLLREAYEGHKLDEQLEERARDFINDERRNTITAEKAEVSRIFSWYSGDFTKENSLREYINQYAETPIGEEVDITFKDYDWVLNAQQ